MIRVCSLVEQLSFSNLKNGRNIRRYHEKQQQLNCENKSYLGDVIGLRIRLKIILKTIMAFQIVQRVAGTQLKTAPYLQLTVRTAASKSVN